MTAPPTLPAVVVTNIAPSATEKDVTSLFSFCGKIKRIKMKSTYDGRQEAGIVFDNASALDTAMLLSNALLVNMPIAVWKFDPSNPNHTQLILEESSLSNRPASTGAPPPLPSRRGNEPQSPKLSQSPLTDVPIDSPPPAMPTSLHRYDNPKVIFVSNLCPTVDENLLIRFFDFCGPVLRHCIDRETQTALIEFRLAKSIKIATLCDGTILGKQELGIEPYDPTKHGVTLYEKMFGCPPDPRQFTSPTDSRAIWQSAPPNASQSEYYSSAHTAVSQRPANAAPPLPPRQSGGISYQAPSTMQQSQQQPHYQQYPSAYQEVQQYPLHASQNQTNYTVTTSYVPYPSAANSYSGNPNSVMMAHHVAPLPQSALPPPPVDVPAHSVFYQNHPS